MGHLENKQIQLGMKAGTASSKLRTLIMFDLVKQLGRDTCYRCNNTIESISEFSIDHKEPWLHNDINLYWDLSNIAFSHKICNTKAARKVSNKGVPNLSHRRKIINGQFLCATCKGLFDKELFHKDKRLTYGIKVNCKNCSSIRNKKRDRRKK